MNIACVWEHNGSDTLLYAVDYPGAFSRGNGLEEARQKMKYEISAYSAWRNLELNSVDEITVVQDADCGLQVRDADSDVLFDAEKAPLTVEQYQHLKAIALKSAADFHALYETIPDKNRCAAPPRLTFYGQVPRSAKEMYLHTKGVNNYYFGEIGVNADNGGTILACRQKGFAELEKQPDFLANSVFEGSYGENWTVRKVLRRFIWHDRIHAKAMYKMAVLLWDENTIADPFHFKTALAGGCAYA